MTVKEPRGTSRPVAGAGRAAIGVSIANIVFYYVSQVAPPELQGEAQFLVTAAVAAGVAWLGKVLRDLGYSKVVV